jgi:hypothetical protein
MRQIIISLMLFSLVLTSCQGQNKENKISETENQPKTDVKVFKEYDDNGNLIKYDSTYTYFYSNIENDSLLKDSILNKLMFGNESILSSNPFFNRFFLKDSLIQNDFYNKDAFMEIIKNNNYHMNTFLQQMDSLERQFFN